MHTPAYLQEPLRENQRLTMTEDENLQERTLIRPAPMEEERGTVDTTRDDPTPPLGPVTVQSPHTAHVRLPKLSLKKFTGS